MYKHICWLIALLFPVFGCADAVYCPSLHGYINVGMTQDEVISACGQPSSKSESNQPVTVKVPVQQVVYNREGSTKAFYGVWALPIGNTPQGYYNQSFGGNSGGGATLQVTIINNKISSVSLNGSSTNAFTVCDNNSVQIGDSVSKLYNACGQPSLVNNSYIEQAVQSATKPQVWVYQFNDYQPAISLTFVDGKLQSIN